MFTQIRLPTVKTDLQPKAPSSIGRDGHNGLVLVQLDRRQRDAAFGGFIFQGSLKERKGIVRVAADRISFDRNDQSQIQLSLVHSLRDLEQVILLGWVVACKRLTSLSYNFAVESPCVPSCVRVVI